jgi:hypothetical protein
MVLRWLLNEKYHGLKCSTGSSKMRCDTKSVSISSKGGNTGVSTVDGRAYETEEEDGLRVKDEEVV